MKLLKNLNEVLVNCAKRANWKEMSELHFDDDNSRVELIVGNIIPRFLASALDRWDSGVGITVSQGINNFSYGNFIHENSDVFYALMNDIFGRENLENFYTEKREIVSSLRGLLSTKQVIAQISIPLLHEGISSLAPAILAVGDPKAALTYFIIKSAIESAMAISSYKIPADFSWAQSLPSSWQM